jgi:hypothetical protein
MVRRPVVGLVLALALFAGCDREAAKTQNEVTPVVMTPVPGYPAWSKPLIGTKVKEETSTTPECRGAFDVVKVRHLGPIPGVEVEGWSWLIAAKRPADHIVFVDRKDVVTGAGETSVNRPDVHAALSEVSQTKVGWHGEIGAIAGTMTALAVLPDGSYCAVGSKEIAG